MRFFLTIIFIFLFKISYSQNISLDSINTTNKNSEIRRSNKFKYNKINKKYYKIVGAGGDESVGPFWGSGRNSIYFGLQEYGPKGWLYEIRLGDGLFKVKKAELYELQSIDLFIGNHKSGNLFRCIYGLEIGAMRYYEPKETTYTQNFGLKVGLGTGDFFMRKHLLIDSHIGIGFLGISGGARAALVF